MITLPLYLFPVCAAYTSGALYGRGILRNADSAEKVSCTVAF